MLVFIFCYVGEAEKKGNMKKRKQQHRSHEQHLNLNLFWLLIFEFKSLLDLSHLKYLKLVSSVWQKKAFTKLWKMVCKKLFSFLKYSIFCKKFSLSRYSRLKGSDETGIIITSWIGMHKLANIIFGRTQKPLCINKFI